MLMKPMQRITRYPLLLKRLQPNLVTDSDDHKKITHIINELEKFLQIVNETVKKKESIYRIKLIDDTMDFGVVAEVFEIKLALPYM